MKIADQPEFNTVWNKLCRDMEKVLSATYAEETRVVDLRLKIAKMQAGLKKLEGMAKTTQDHNDMIKKNS